MEQFKLHTRTSGDFSVVDLYGELDAHTAPRLEEVFQHLIAEQQYHIIVNCTNLTYISSAGLGVFMAYIEEVRQHSGDIKLTNMNSKVYNVFDLLGFPTLYDILPDENEAISQFNNSK